MKLRTDVCRFSIVLPCFAIVLFHSLASAQDRRDPIRLTHGPMLGQPTATSMVVWARTSEAGTFTVHYGTQPDPLDQISAPATTANDDDNTGVA